jgi:Spy/CpxP family protein refolding chaperone
MTTKLIVIAGFIIAFAAGLMTGMQHRQTVTVVEPSTMPSTRPQFRGRNNRGDPGIVIRELGLTPEQSAKMREIWSEVAMRGGPNQEDARRKLRQQRDEQMLALVPEANRAQYEQVQTDFAENIAKLDQEFRSAYDQAIEKTKKILSPEQRMIYEKILERNQWDRNRGGRGGPGRGGRRDEDRDRSGKSQQTPRLENRATSQPSEGQ